MSSSLILRVATRVLLPLLGVFSLFLLLRGHNEPGGGFVGGLLAAGGVALVQLAEGTAMARRVLRADPRSLVAAGLLAAVASGLAGVAGGRPFMTGEWLGWALPGLGKVGTPLLFDLGVYLVVLGSALLILFTLGDAEEERE